MQDRSDSALWRPGFVTTLQLLGQAAARQTFGIPDPVLCGASAVELYTGGLWSAGCLEVFAVDARTLNAELFAAGFRWSQRPRHPGRGLWHAGLQIGIDIISDHASCGLAVQSNVLTVALDLGVAGPADRDLAWLKVVGIEDLIVEEIACRPLHGALSGEAAAKTRVLAALGREGVGGRLRSGYLHRRLIWETHGEVAFEAQLLDGAEDHYPAPRIISLTRMRTLLHAWHVRCGYAFDRLRLGWPRAGCETGPREMRNRKEKQGRAGRPSVMAANIVPLDAAQSALPD